MKISVATPKTIHVIGDSHALAFKNKSIGLPDLGTTYSSKVCYVRGLQFDTLAPEGMLHKDISSYFLSNELVTSDGMPIALTDDAAVVSERYATGSGFQCELVVFHLGEIYVRKYLGTLFARGDLDAKVGELDEDRIETDIRSIAKLYVKAIAKLSTSFDLKAIVHEICPPTSDDAQFEKINNFRCSSKMRGSIYGLFNGLIQSYAASAAIPFCETNDYLIGEDGCLDPEYEFDGVHADPKYTITSLGRIARLWLYSRSSTRTKRYGKWLGGVPTDGAFPRVSQIGVSKPIAAFDEGQVSQLLGSTGQFEYQVCNNPVNDWSHAPPDTDYPKFKPVIKYGVVEDSGLALLHDVLIKGPIGDQIRKLLGAKFSIVNVRPVESVAHEDEGVGQQIFHRDGCPVGIYRGLIYLVDVGEDDGGFEYYDVDGNPEPKQVHGAAGSLILFDANAVKHRATPPRTRTRLALDLIMLVIPEDVPEIVHCADLGYIWPIDPYMFSLSERCHPKIKSGRWFTPSLIANLTNKIKTL